MIKLDSVYRQLAKKHNLTLEEVKEICTSEFKFVAEVMNDPEDTTPILIHNLFRFKLKPRFQQNKQSKWSPK